METPFKFVEVDGIRYVSIASLYDRLADKEKLYENMAVEEEDPTFSTQLSAMSTALGIEAADLAHEGASEWWKGKKLREELVNQLGVSS